MPEQLFNEQQESIHDTELSIACDDYAKACQELEGWKKEKEKCSLKLIQRMKEAGLKSLRVGNDKLLEYKYVDAKEGLVMKDYKPKSKKRGGRRARF